MSKTHDLLAAMVDRINKSPKAYEETVYGEEVSLIPGGTVTFTGTQEMLLHKLRIVAGHKYKVIFDGTEYAVTASVGETSKFVLIGSEEAAMESADGEFPFAVFCVDLQGMSYTVYCAAEAAEHTIEVIHIGEDMVHTLEEKYTGSSWLATKGYSTVELIPEQTVEFSLDEDGHYKKDFGSENANSLSKAEFAIVGIDGVQYEVAIGYFTDGVTITYMGNMDLLWNGVASDNLPFCVVSMSNELFFAVNEAGSKTISVTLYVPEYRTLPTEYIPPETPVIPSATVGQYVRVKAVDGNGVPTDWEAAELPGAVILQVDSENYLYAEGADTTDTSQRMTKAELEAAFRSGVTMYIKLNTGDDDLSYYSASCGFSGDFGVAMIPKFEYVAYTAEYTAKT